MIYSIITLKNVKKNVDFANFLEVWIIDFEFIHPIIRFFCLSRRAKFQFDLENKIPGYFQDILPVKKAEKARANIF